MAGPIMFCQMVEGKKEPLITVINLNGYECKTQIDAMEAQAISADKMLVVTATLRDYPPIEEPPEEEGEDAKTG